MRKPLSQESIELIQTLGKDGVSVKEIANIVGASTTTVYNYIIKDSIKSRGSKFESLSRYKAYLKRNFKSYKDFKRYLELREFFGEGLKGVKTIKSGYDIKNIRSLRNKNNAIAIELLEDILDESLIKKGISKEDLGFDSEMVKNDFDIILKKLFHEVSGDSYNVDGSFDIYYRNNKLIIEPKNLESRAFLSTYGSISKRKKIIV
jgi:hypothetical protein